MQKQAVIISIQAAISQIIIKRNSALMFSNRQESVAVADKNTEMITETINLLSRANSVLTEISDVEMKSMSLNY